MARSVSRHSNAYETVYLHGISFTWDQEQEPEDDSEENSEDDSFSFFEFSDFLEYLVTVIQFRYPSFEVADRWEGRENHVVLENGSAEISVAEYNGLISICLAPREPSDCSENHAMDYSRNKNWTRMICDNFKKELHKAFHKQALNSTGTFSNGEQAFVPVSRPGGVVTSKEGVLW